MEEVKDTQTITRKYANKTITFERKRKAINQDAKKQIRISKELVSQVEEKLEAMKVHEKEYSDFSSLVRFLLEEWLIQFKNFK